MPRMSARVYGIMLRKRKKEKMVVRPASEYLTLFLSGDLNAFGRCAYTSS